MLQASRHQGALLYRGGGRQCVANSLLAAVTAKEKPLHEWDGQTMDHVLEEGDHLYMGVVSGTDKTYLRLEDIPPKVGTFVVTIEKTVHGTLNRSKTEEPFFSLEDSLTKLVTNDSQCLFTMGASTPCYTCAIMTGGQLLYFFDPHCRNEVGMVAADGYATMTIHKNTADLSRFIRHLAASIYKSAKTCMMFEIATLRLEDPSYSCKSDSESEFSGFSAFSEGYESSRLHSPEENISDVSSVRSSSVSDVSSCSVSDVSSCSEIDSLSDSNTDSRNGVIRSSDVDDNDQKNESESRHGKDNVCVINVESNDGENRDNVSEISVESDESDVDDDDDDDDDDDIPLSSLMKKSNSVSGDYLGPISNDDESDEDIPLSNLQNKQNSNQNPILNIDKTPETEFDNSESTANRGRKRKRDELKWKRNIMKKRRNEGQNYITRTGNKKPQKMMQKGCGHSCRYKCHSKFNEGDRERLHHSFWKIGDINKKRQFLSKFAVKKVKKRNKKKEYSRRRSTISWSFPTLGEGNTCKQVCKTFFLHTLGISDRMISTVHKKVNSIGVCDGDQRGKHSSRPRKLSYEQEILIKEHIQSFEAIESHYCRKDTNKRYLPASLNVIKMHTLYESMCRQHNIAPVSVNLYRQVFDSCFNISFQKPKKDQCDLCVGFQKASSAEKLNLSKDYEKHLKNKNLARKHKETDKSRAKNENDLVAACFDLEEVLMTPHGFESCLYYKRRLNTYNFTLYDLASREGFSYIWNETISNRGACEVASCVYSYIKEKSEHGKKNFVFFSDNCCGQNKNRFYITMLWFCLQQFDLHSIEHKYLEKGHSQNENDSTHAAVETASRHISVHTTAQWAATVRAARPQNPYHVKEMCLSDFYDFKSVSGVIKNFDQNTESEKMYWGQVKRFQIFSSDPNTLCYQTDFDGPVLKLDLFKRLRTKDVPNPKDLDLPQLRHTYIELKWEKYRDLVILCRNGIIPRAHHPFFLLMPHESARH